MKKILFWFVVVVIILFIIGIRGVYVDPMLVDIDKKRYILKYIIVILGGIAFLIFLKYKK